MTLICELRVVYVKLILRILYRQLIFKITHSDRTEVCQLCHCKGGPETQGRSQIAGSQYQIKQAVYCYSHPFVLSSTSNQGTGSISLFPSRHHHVV